MDDDDDAMRVTNDQDSIPGPKKTKVVVKDVAYATYFAFLYYLYTDSIVFSPLTSDFLAKSASEPVSASSTSNSDAQHQPQSGYSPSSSHNNNNSSSTAHGPAYQNHMLGENGEASHRSRSDWVRAWMHANPGKPAPCSAKACYRLADKLGLTELRARAFQHIVKSLTVTNVPYEVFSSFSAAFEDIRKVQVEFFLMNWSEIKSNDAMRNVFQQIRLGRHPGFEEVWPAIIVNLEFMPKTSETSAEGREVTLA